MIKGVAFTKEKQLPFYARVNEAGIPRVFTFLNLDGTPHPISGYDFKVKVKEREFYPANLFELSVGSGLTVQGASLNQLLISPTKANFTRKVGTNFWTLYSEADENTWINGPFYFHDGKFDGLETETETIHVGGSNDVTITISVGTGGTTDGVTYKGLWSGTTALPSTALSGSIYKLEFECIVSFLGGNVTYQSGSLIMSLASNSGSPANWVVIGVLPTVTPTTESFTLREDGFYILREDSFRFIKEN